MYEANNHCGLITSHTVHMYQVLWISEGVVIFCVDLAWNYPIGFRMPPPPPPKKKISQNHGGRLQSETRTLCVQNPRRFT